MAGTQNTVTFNAAAIKQLNVKQLVSGDKEYELKLRTGDQGVMLTDLFDAATTFKVTLEAE